MPTYPFTRIKWHELGIVPRTGMQFWHSYQAGVVSGSFLSDPSGNNRHLFSSGATPALQTNVVHGQPAWYFNGSTTIPLATASSTAVPLRHYFVLAAHEDATFNLNRGLTSGKTTHTLLASNSSGTTFFDLGLGAGFEYRKSNVVYTQATQQAPMGKFELIEVVLPPGFALDGVQVGKQRDLAGRIWKGWFVDHLGFNRVLGEEARRRVLLYYSLRYGAHIGSQIPLFFPSSNLIGTGVVSDAGVIRNRFYNVPRQWEAITEDYEFEDSNKTFNEFGDDPPRRWEYRYVNVSKEQAVLFDVFNDTARRANPFYFKDPEGRVWSNVRIENYERNHDAHKRWVHEVNISLVGQSSTSVFEEFISTPPEAPDDLALEVMGESSILATWGETDVEAPSAPVLLSATADSDTAITMVWSASTDNVGVTGYETRIDGGAWSDRGLVLTYQYTGLTDATEYDFEVRAYDAAGNFSTPSNLISETTDVAAFDPADIADLHQWLKADSLALSDGAAVATWLDSGPENNDAGQATSGFRPVFKTNILNGKPVVRFDGVAGNYLDIGNFSALTEAEAFIVVKINTEPPGGSSTAGLWRIGTDADWTYFPFTDGNVYDDFGSTVRKSTGNPTPALTSFNIYNVWSASADWASEFNGAAHFSTGTNTPGFASVCYLGASDNGTVTPRYIDGDIAEFIIYSRKLNGTERGDVVAYLETKYGL